MGASDGGEGGAYPGGRGSIGAVQGCPPELWTRLVGVMEHSGHTGLLGVYWVYTGCILGVYWVYTGCILGLYWVYRIDNTE